MSLTEVHYNGVPESIPILHGDLGGGGESAPGTPSRALRPSKWDAASAPRFYRSEAGVRDTPSAVRSCLSLTGSLVRVREGSQKDCILRGRVLSIRRRKTGIPWPITPTLSFAPELVLRDPRATVPSAHRLSHHNAIGAPGAISQAGVTQAASLTHHIERFLTPCARTIPECAS